ncbi:DUF2550 family protein [Jatrophihabitans sp.]|uniref:DUF2550 family protein n=1 Tax=Jatrophihabitans sp. TaxID=1932789 RepID=UPI0038CD2A7A
MLVQIPISVIVRRAISRRHASRGEVECAVRPLDTSAAEPGGKWQHGVATASSHELTFRPRRGSIGVRTPLGSPRSFLVSSTTPDTGVHPRLREAWFINPGLHVIELRTSDGPVSLAARASDITSLIARLAC